MPPIGAQILESEALDSSQVDIADFDQFADLVAYNVSDVVSNALIVASNSNGEVTWEPCLSLNDSSVVLPAKGVCDLS